MKKTNYLQNEEVILHSFQKISVLIIIIAIFLPWIQVRVVSLQSLYCLCAEYISSNSMSSSYMIGDYFQRFEITTGYISSFANDDGIVRCDPDHIFYFKKFCDHINEGAVVRPYRYYLGHNQSGACQLEYYSYEKYTNHPNNNIFKLFYMFPYNLTHDIIRVYNETVDFKNWNYFTDGEFVDFVDCVRSNINFQMETMHKEPYWSTGLAHFGSQNESRVFTINYPILGKYDLTNNRTNILKKFPQNKIINDKNRKESRPNFTMKYQSSKIDKTIPKTNWIINLFYFIFYYETKIMNKILGFGENNLSYAKSIDEARNRIQINQQEINKFYDSEDDSIIVTDVGSSFFTESLYVILKEKKNDKLNHYIITDYLYNVLIDNEMGALYPKYFTNLNQSVFPKISDLNNSIWKFVENEIINVPTDVPLLVNTSVLTQYMIIKRIINARSRYSFYLIMIFEVNTKTRMIFSTFSYIFLTSIAFLCIVIIFAKFSMTKEDEKCNSELKQNQKTMIGMNFNRSNNKYMGNITEAIEKLRKIQLLNSDDTRLNNLIDFVTKELTLHNKDLFNIEIDLAPNHSSSTFYQFYYYLADNNHDLTTLKNKKDEIRKERANLKSRKILNYYLKDSDKKDKNTNLSNIKGGEDKLFILWKNKMNLILNSKVNEDLLNVNPHKFLVRIFMKFILKRNLLFVEISPDLLLSFILTYTKENISSYHCKIKSYQLLKKLIKHNFSFWIKSKYDIFIIFLASILRNSKIKKHEEIIDLFNSFFSFHDEYLTCLLNILIKETKTNFIMDIYGSLLNRTQSPTFSVPNNLKDMVLFMKALLSFIDFAPYLTEHNKNGKCFSEINEITFSKNEKENPKFISSFHYELSKNVVLPWLNLMNSISPQNNIQNTLVDNINFWNDKNKHID